MLLYFDTETSGLNPGQICQLTYIIQDGERLTPKNFFFTVDFVEYSAYLVHGFSIDILRELSLGKRFCDCADEILADFEKADVIIAHNADFDMKFMRAECQYIDRIFRHNQSLCSMRSTVSMCKIPRANGYGYKYPKLTELMCFLNIRESEVLDYQELLFGSSKGTHDARFDTTALMLCVQKLMDNHYGFIELKEYV